MADEKNPFLDGLDPSAENPFLAGLGSDSGQKKAPPRAEPITWDERLKATLLFDDSPKRRAAYLKRIGFEMDPKNDNLIRPMGSSGEYTKLDPGGLKDVSQYYKDGKKAGLKELALDTVEAMDNFFQGAVEEAVGQGAGIAAAGGATPVTGGLGTVPAYVGGRAMGRATASLLLGSAKEALGDIFLDEEIPVEMQDKLFKAAVTSVAPEAMAGIAKPAIKGAKNALSGLRSGFKALLNIGGGNVSEAALDAVARDPKTFTNMDNLKNATAAISEKISALTGLGPEDGIPKKFRDLGENSMFKTKMAESEALRRDTVNKLAGDSGASTNVGFIVDMLEQAKNKILGDKPIKSKDTQAVAAQFDDYMNQVKQAAGEGGTVNFKQLDNMIKEIQTDAFGAENAVASELRSFSKTVNDYAKSLANRVAQTSGLDISDYAASKAKEAKIFDAYESFAKNVTPSKIVANTIGGGTKTAKGSGADITREALTNTFAKLDDALDTQISEAVQTGQLQAELFRAIESSKVPRGSGGAVARGAVGALGAGAATGFNPLAMTLGAAGGVVAGEPAMGLKAVGGLTRGMNQLDNAVNAVSSFQTAAPEVASSSTQELLRTALQGSRAVPTATNAILDKFQKQPEEENPFLKGL